MCRCSLIPAYAGVILGLRFWMKCIFPYPRVCGGDPQSYAGYHSFFDLIPAHAGVILSGVSSDNPLESYPRACGGDPEVLRSKINALDLSPRMRG
mgnify:FL=1